MFRCARVVLGFVLARRGLHLQRDHIVKLLWGDVLAPVELG